MRVSNFRYILALALFCATLLVSCTKDPDVESSTGSTTDDEISAATRWVDESLEKYYLYNEEYKGMDRDLTLSYDTFLDRTLLRMTTNLYDKKYYETLYGMPFYDYMLFSNVSRKPVEAKSRAFMGSRESVGYGFVNLALASSQAGIVVAVSGVYEGSPAAEGGLLRGTIIKAVNGKGVTLYDFYKTTLYDMLYPSSGDQIKLTTVDDVEITLEATTIEINPILHKEIIEPNIGYLVYSSFDTNFDNDLKGAIKEFSQAGVEELILDLRLNLGGYNNSAALLGAMIGGDYCTGKVFSYYRFNGDMTRDYSTTTSLLGFGYSSADELFFDDFPSTSISLDLPTPRIYCLVSDFSASASEMVINSLRGVGFEVVLIGSKTRGKNVGMIVFDKVIGEYEYSLLPITFENLNAKLEGGYSGGLEVDYEVDDLTTFSDYGATEPMVAKALELITGEVAPIADDTRSGSTLDLKPIMGEDRFRYYEGGLYVTIDK